MPRHGEQRPTYQPKIIEKYCANCKKWYRININYQAKDRCPGCRASI